MKQGGGRSKGNSFERQVAKKVVTAFSCFGIKQKDFVLDQGIKKEVYSKDWHRCVFRVCQFCRKKFDAPLYMIAKGWCRFCSQTCRNKGLTNAGVRNGNWRGGSPTRKCGQCSKPFKPERGNVRRGFGYYCSKRCWWRYRCKNLGAYRGSIFKSLWEKGFAQWLSKQGLHYRYEPKKFDVGWFYYTPDFYVREWGTYVEIKGHFSKANKERFSFFRKLYPKIPIILFRGKHLQCLRVIV